MNRWLSFAVGAASIGFLAYQLYKQGGWGDQYLTTKDNKFLGLFPTDSEFGFDDVARGAVLVGTGAMAIRLAHQVGLPASTSLPV